MFRAPTHKSGTTLVETLVYVVVFIILLLTIVSSLLFIGRSYKRVKATAAIERSSLAVFDRMIREIRTAKTLDLAQSTLGSSPGRLTLNTTDGAGVAQTIEFFVSAGVIRIKENGVDKGPLTDSTASVTSLIFQSINSGRSTAVKISLTIQSGSGSASKTANFYTTVILRNS